MISSFKRGSLSRWRQALVVYGQPKVIGIGFLGFSSGLPYLLVDQTLSAWLKQADVSLTVIGFASMLGVLYSIKFFWAPVIDRLPLPILTRLLGKRRSWMLLAQLGIAIGLMGMASTDPGEQLSTTILFALLVAFSSATQDVSVDAWRIEAVAVRMQGAMAATYQTGYRLAMLAAGAGAFYVAALSSWPTSYAVMSVLVTVGMITVLLINEPAHQQSDNALAREQRVIDFIASHGHWSARRQRLAAWLIGAVVCPFADFFGRYGRPALVILAFISIYRISEVTLGVLANPFYLDLGYTLTEIASIAKIFGVGMTLAGAALGGIMVMRYGVLKTLFIGAILMPATNLLFVWLGTHLPSELFITWQAQTLQQELINQPIMQYLLLPDFIAPWQPQSPGLLALAVAISSDNLATGLAGTAFIAYLSSLTNTGYTATQYALFSSLMTLPGKFIGGFSGMVVDHFSYVVFFSYTAIAGLPAIILAAWLWRYHARRNPNA